MTAMAGKQRLFPEAPLQAVVFCFIRLNRFDQVPGLNAQNRNCRKEVMEE